jgi:outer membrane protein assembly factor BamD
MKINQTKIVNFFKIILISIFLISLANCGKKKEEENSAEKSYIEAVRKLNNKNYATAATEFAKIIDDYPFSKWAIRGQAMAVYCYFKEENYPSLIQIVDDFIRLNPASEMLDYMLYMKGLSYFNQIPEISRAQDDTLQASSTFRELVARFPDSKYVDDAKKKIIIIDENLAGSKMYFARFEMNHNNFVGAIKNLVEVTQRYKNTHQVAEAYFRLAEIYYKIGLDDQFKDAYNELIYLYPESFWAKELTKKISKNIKDE